jgi:predicted  nucleic acid-binding Zn-ribbon protein
LVYNCDKAKIKEKKMKNLLKKILRLKELDELSRIKRRTESFTVKLKALKLQFNELAAEEINKYYKVQKLTNKTF